MRKACHRLASYEVDFQSKRLMDAIKAEQFDPQSLSEYASTGEDHLDHRVPSALVMNKVDLVTNRR